MRSVPADRLRTEERFADVGHQPERERDGGDERALRRLDGILGSLADGGVRRVSGVDAAVDGTATRAGRERERDEKDRGKGIRFHCPLKPGWREKARPEGFEPPTL